VTSLDPRDAYALWAESYDSDLNPVVALEARMMRECLDLSPGMRVLDLGTGTGRWLQYALNYRASAYGMDLSREMLKVAALKQGLRGRLVEGSLERLPFPDQCADLAICSLSLGYAESPLMALREMKRVARNVVISDLHPKALKAGWVRSFRAQGQSYEIANRSYSLPESDWQLEAFFGEPERAIFKQAGKGGHFESARQIPAIFIAGWNTV